MEPYPECLDAMLAAWNESDPTKIRAHLEKALEETVHFVDPANDVAGIDAFEAMVHDVQSKIPGAVYSRQGGVDSHHDLYRYHWAIHLNGELLTPGFDVTEVSTDGKVSRVIGFFGHLDDK